jgi:predicted anti-sigma-YlaC factor YlaD
MSCQPWTEALSALADGEDPGIDARLLDAHLASCAGCRRYQASLEATRRPLRVRAAEPMPDLSSRVVKLNAVADRASRWATVRGLLAVVAAQIIVLSAPALILGDEAGSSHHDARHLGAFSVAYAVGLLVVVVRPARARTMLPVAQVLGAALAISTIVDVADRSVALSGEIVHLPELLSVALLWLLAIPAPRTRATQPGRPDIKLVEHPDQLDDEAI